MGWGIETYIASSGRVFPSDMKAATATARPGLAAPARNRRQPAITAIAGVVGCTSGIACSNATGPLHKAPL